MRDTIENFIKEYPNRQQVQMMNAWLENNKPGKFQFTGLVDPTDGTVITPQATVDYGYNWFSLTEGPAIIRTTRYDKFFSVSIFDMLHNTPAVIVQPQKPILLMRPGQSVPPGDYHVVKLETDQGLAFTRMVVVNNMDEVRELSRSITMEGGQGDMRRAVERFSPHIEQAALALLAAALPIVTKVAEEPFGRQSGEIGDITLAAAVMIGQLGTPADTVRYRAIMTDAQGEPFNGEHTYVLTVPAGIVHPNGYYSITVYGTDNKLLIPNAKKIYDRTTYTSEQNTDGTYTVTLSPAGDGLNGIPTGKPFYALLRAYVPVQGADMTVGIEKR